MKKGFYIFIFFLFCLTSNAQKYGVSVGYAYSYGKVEHPLEMRDFYNYEFRDVKFKYNLVPNAFIRPYLRVYNKLNIFCGVDVTQYEINFDQINGNNNFWHKKIKQLDLHFPIGLKINLLDENKKTGHSLYGGIFFINRLKGTEWLGVNGGSEISNSKGFGVEPRLIIFNNRKNNFIVGYEFNYKFKEWFSLSSNLYLKYMPVYIDYSSPTGADLFPTLRNKFSFSISVGCSFMKPPKQKEEDASKVFRLDQ